MVGATILGLSFLSSPAAAEKVPPGGDSHQQGCRRLQSRAEALLAEYKRLGDDLGFLSGSGKAAAGERMKEILGELQSINSDWKQIGCQRSWGDIAKGMPKPPPPGPAKQPVPKQPAKPVPSKPGKPGPAKQPAPEQPAAPGSTK
jgi:hypothetical protein